MQSRTLCVRYGLRRVRRRRASRTEVPTQSVGTIGKPKYISKADRAKLEAEATQEPITPAD
nr:DUF2986 domain-containing protein [Pseudomonas alcaliphila]